MIRQLFNLSGCGLAAAGLLAGLIFVAVPVQAQDDLEKPPQIPAATAEEEPLPPKVQGEQLEPTVTIRYEKERRVEEYSYNGRVYMVKVSPQVGPSYYFIDADGDGSLDTTTSRGLEPVQPVFWKIKEWR